MPAGRPTLYTPELLEQAMAYINGEWLEQGDPYPMLSGLAVNLDVCRDTVQVWAADEDKPEFSYIVKRLMAIQERVLFRGGIKGDFNATITKLALTKHGYSDKTENTLQGGDKPITITPWQVTGVSPT